MTLLLLVLGGTLKEINDFEAGGHDPAIPATLTLYKYAINHGVAVFFVTGRREYERAETARNLRTVGYHHWKGLFLEPNDYDKTSAVSFKVAQRKKIVKMGYDVVENVGDQYSDLRGGYSDMTFKLPNPYYHVG